MNMKNFTAAANSDTVKANLFVYLLHEIVNIDAELTAITSERDQLKKQVKAGFGTGVFLEHYREAYSTARRKIEELERQLAETKNELAGTLESYRAMDTSHQAIIAARNATIDKLRLELSEQIKLVNVLQGRRFNIPPIADVRAFNWQLATEQIQRDMKHKQEENNSLQKEVQQLQTTLDRQREGNKYLEDQLTEARNINNGLEKNLHSKNTLIEALNKQVQKQREHITVLANERDTLLNQQDAIMKRAQTTYNTLLLIFKKLSKWWSSDHNVSVNMELLFELYKIAWNWNEDTLHIKVTEEFHDYWKSKSKKAK